MPARQIKIREDDYTRNATNPAFQNRVTAEGKPRLQEAVRSMALLWNREERERLSDDERKAHQKKAVLHQTYFHVGTGQVKAVMAQNRRYLESRFNPVNFRAALETRLAGIPEDQVKPKGILTDLLQEVGETEASQRAFLKGYLDRCEAGKTDATFLADRAVSEALRSQAPVFVRVSGVDAAMVPTYNDKGEKTGRTVACSVLGSICTAAGDDIRLNTLEKPEGPTPIRDELRSMGLSDNVNPQYRQSLQLRVGSLLGTRDILIPDDVQVPFVSKEDAAAMTPEQRAEKKKEVMNDVAVQAAAAAGIAPRAVLEVGADRLVTVLGRSLARPDGVSVGLSDALGDKFTSQGSAAARIKPTLSGIRVVPPHELAAIRKRYRHNAKANFVDNALGNLEEADEKAKGAQQAAAASKDSGL